MKQPEFVAIIEDDIALSQDLGERLGKSGIGFRAFNSRQDFRQSMERGDHYDAIILDWYLDDQTSSVVARLVLVEDIRDRLFVPVLIYTEERSVAQVEVPTLPAPFDRIQVFDKEEIAPEALVGEMKKWYAQSMGAGISAIWRSVRHQALEKSLYDLDALEGENFYRTLQHILVMETGETPDVDHALEFLERYVQRRVLADITLRGELKKELEEAQRGLKRRGDQEVALVNAHRYILPTDFVARTGDVVEVLDELRAPIAIAVCITPACDLDQCKCFELRVVLAEERPAVSQANSEWALPAVRGSNDAGYRNFVLNFHNTMFLRDKSIGTTREERQRRLITYEHSFEDAFGHKLWLRPICRLDDPYRADLLQNFASHASRVGTP